MREIKQMTGMQDTEGRDAAPAAFDWQGIVETLPTGFFVGEIVRDAAGSVVNWRYLYANAAWELMTGLRRAEVIGRTVSDVVPGIERHWIERFGRVVDTTVGESMLERVEELGRWFDAHVASVGGDRFTVSFVEATQRVAQSAELQLAHEGLRRRLTSGEASLRLYADIVRFDTSPICAFDHDYRLIAFNPAHSDEFFRIFGHRVSIGEVFPNLFPPDQAAVIRGFMARALAGEAFIVNEEFGSPDLAKPLWEVSYSPLRSAEGNVVGAFHHARDISDRARAQAELASTQEILRQSQKMEAVGQLTGGLAHDFNNLLAAISGSLEMIESRIRQGRVGEIGRYVDAGHASTKRAAALTHRLLAFSRRQTLEPKTIDANRLVADMEPLIVGTVGPAITVARVADPDLWPVSVDLNQLENALLNLCLNARDAITGGGQIEIETANHRFDETQANERELPAGDYVSLCVTDTGVGMAAEVMARAFDPFFTTKPIGLGTGLGLSMIYGFARQSGGQARIRSQEGRGTAVCIYLPRHEAPVAFEDERDDGIVPPVAAGRTVLVVDDEPMVRMLMVDAVEELGHVAIEAGDGLQAMEVLRSDATIDLLLTDVGLPNGMNGRQVADAARELRPQLDVIFVTGYAQNAVLTGGPADRGMQVLTKPFTMGELARRIRTVLDD